VLTVTNSQGTSSTACTIEVNVTSPDPSGTPITGPVTITRSGRYYLVNDIHSDNSGTCINISGSDVSIDGRGYTISGTKKPETYGIGAVSGDTPYSNIIISNLSVTRFEQGVLFSGISKGGRISKIQSYDNTIGISIQDCDAAEVLDTEVTGNANTGMNIVASSHLTLLHNSVRNNQESGIILDASNNNTMAGNSALNNKNGGMWLFASRYNNVYGNNVRENGNFGIGFGRSFSNVLTDNHVSENDNGIMIANSAKNIYESNNVSSNSLDGFFLFNSEENNLSVNYAQNNVQHGIEVLRSRNNTVLGNTISGNTRSGINLSESSDGNLFTRNTITGNRDSGISLVLSSNSNLIYNNLFNNNRNVYVTDSTGNTWNISLLPGINIIGGPNLGGNYWAKPDGAGWSQVTPDRGDGFCNAPFVIDANNTDYLPLHTHTPQPYDYNLTLGEGWNLVSVPKKLAPGYDTGSIFNNVVTEGRTIWEYDGVIHNWVPIYADTPVLPLYGFWIYSKSPTTVPLKFDPNPLQIPPTRNLVKGWELIGFTGTIPASARDTLISVRNTWTQAMGFDTPAYHYDVQIINGGSGQFSDSRPMNPTKGYWLFMTGPGDLSAIGV